MAAAGPTTLGLSILHHDHVPCRWLEVDQSDEAARLLEVAARRAGGRPPRRVGIAAPPRSARRRARPEHRADPAATTSASSAPAGQPGGRSCATYEGLEMMIVERDAPGGPGRAEHVDRGAPRLPRPSGADSPPRGRRGVSDEAEIVLARDVDFGPAVPCAPSLLDGFGRRRGPALPGGRRVSFISAPGSTARRPPASTTAPARARRRGTAARTCTSSARPTWAGTTMLLNFAQFTAKVRAHHRAPLWRRPCTVPRDPHQRRAQHQGPLRRDRRPAATGASKASRSATGRTGGVDDVATGSVFIFIGPPAPATELARGRARPAPVRADRARTCPRPHVAARRGSVRAGDQRARRLHHQRSVVAR